MLKSGINILKIITVLVLVVINLRSEEFFISFQYEVSNFKISYSNFNCSKAFTSTYQRGKKLIFSLPADNENIKNLCYKHKDEIVDHLLKDEVVVSNNDDIYNSSIKTHTKLTYLPVRFDIIIKNGVAYFYKKGE